MMSKPLFPHITNTEELLHLAVTRPDALLAYFQRLEQEHEDMISSCRGREGALLCFAQCVTGLKYCIVFLLLLIMWLLWVIRSWGKGCGS